MPESIESHPAGHLSRKKLPTVPARLTYQPFDPVFTRSSHHLMPSER